MGSALVLLSIEGGLTLASLLAFLAVLRRRNPLGILRDGLLRMVRERPYRCLLICFVLLPAVDLVETRYDPAVTAWLGYDATALIHRIEGGGASVFQRFQSRAADWILTYAYIVVLPVLILGPLIIAAREADLRRYRELSLGLLVNYAVGLPFYFLMPVQEMWSGNPEKVSLLMDHVSPAIMEAYRANSALDNCFPSLHTSLALTAALLSAPGERRPIAAVIWILSLAVVLSTLYLGIHWASDVVSGAVLALAAAALARRLAARMDGQPIPGKEGRGPLS